MSIWRHCHRWTAVVGMFLNDFAPRFANEKRQTITRRSHAAVFSPFKWETALWSRHLKFKLFAVRILCLRLESHIQLLRKSASKQILKLNYSNSFPHQTHVSVSQHGYNLLAIRCCCCCLNELSFNLILILFTICIVNTALINVLNNNRFCFSPSRSSHIADSHRTGGNLSLVLWQWKSPVKWQHANSWFV